MKSNKLNNRLISNAESQINQAAKTLNVDPIVIRVAKYLSKSNDRETIYRWIENHMGDTMGILITKLK